MVFWLRSKSNPNAIRISPLNQICFWLGLKQTIYLKDPTLDLCMQNLRSQISTSLLPCPLSHTLFTSSHPKGFGRPTIQHARLVRHPLSSIWFLVLDCSKIKREISRRRKEKERSRKDQRLIKGLQAWFKYARKIQLRAEGSALKRMNPSWS